MMIFLLMAVLLFQAGHAACTCLAHQLSLGCWVESLYCSDKPWGLSDQATEIRLRTTDTIVYSRLRSNALIT